MTHPKQTSLHGSLVALSTMKDEGPTVVEWVAITSPSDLPK